MKSVLFVLPALLSAVGCCGGGPKAGFTLAYHLPPTLSQQTLVSPQQTMYAAQGLACGPVAGGLGVYAAEAKPLALQTVERAVVERAPVPMRMTSECTMDEICRRLESISRTLEALPKQSRMPPEE